MRSLITLLRPQQWLKNLFVFLPAFFSGNIFSLPVPVESVIAFIAFSLAASAIYCLNDLIDVEADRLHPTKCNRPIAAGLISTRQALLIMLLTAVAALILPFLLIPLQQHYTHPQTDSDGIIHVQAAIYTSTVIAIYLLLNIAYCLKLKQLSLIDIFIIAIGFDLRVAAGGAATGIMISHWIIIMTFLLALFLALCKRRDDIVIYENSGRKMRRNIDKYNRTYINQAITLVATIMLVSYIMYTVSPEVEQRFNSDLVYITSIFVLAGLLRYMQLATVFGKTGSPTKILLHDRITQACIIAWALTFATIIYL
ncbi:MAG: UbiA prenyltransferase family protein [Muribaculaceae bacterium]|nr:UbiA prenyltransferase family protein [Muribaculaceae bacterium]